MSPWSQFRKLLCAVAGTAIPLAALTSASAAPPAVPPAVAPADASDLAALQIRFMALARRAAPAIVAISAAQAPVQVAGGTGLSSEQLSHALAGVQHTVGTGFIISPDGYILTNEHVTAHAQQLWVTTDQRQVYPAVVVGTDPRHDLALVKVPASALPSLHFADPGAVARGQWAISLGNPFGLATEGEMAMSIGIVSALDRSLAYLGDREDRLYTNLIQTTAQINPGNSGGPLLDLQGRVIGISTAVILPTPASNGVGFAIPITPRLLDIVQHLKEGREIAHGYLGIASSPPTPEERQRAGINQAIGARVGAVQPGSPAHRSGLRDGDLIVSLGTTAVRGVDHLARLIDDCTPQQPVRLLVRRGPQQLALDIRPERRQSSPADTSSPRLRWRGLLLGPVPANWSSSGHAPGAIILAVDQDSPLRDAGIDPGSVITAVGGQPVANLLDIDRILSRLPSDQAVALRLSDPDGATRSLERVSSSDHHEIPWKTAASMAR